MGWSLFTPHFTTSLDMGRVTLPKHGADVISRKLMENYGAYKKETLFIEETVYSGETLSSISIKYGISRETILHVNGIHDVKKLLDLDKLMIPSVDGIIHKLSNKDSLDSLSKKYGVLVKDIFRVNNLKSENLSDLETLYIPGIQPQDWGWHTNLDKYYIYPVNGYITKRYGFHTNSITGLTSLYEGTDFVSIDNSDVLASRAGYISRIGYSPNYGHYIYLDHSGGTRTLYAHLDNISVDIRDSVKQGDVIGTIGKSGFTNTTKLFFTLFYKDETVNPENYLR
jgi:murein DD-endopeptidase MepM/ murein hydrolase activator NlpD